MRFSWFLNFSRTLCFKPVKHLSNRFDTGVSKVMIIFERRVGCWACSWLRVGSGTWIGLRRISAICSHRVFRRFTWSGNPWRFSTAIPLHTPLNRRFSTCTTVKSRFHPLKRLNRKSRGCESPGEAQSSRTLRGFHYSRLPGIFSPV